MSDSGENDKTHPFHYEGGQPIFDGPEQHEQRANEARYAKEQEYKERQLLIESEQISLQKANFRTQVALVIFGLIGIGVNIYQAHISKISADTSKVNADAAKSAADTAAQTLNEMRTGSGAADTHTLAQVAKDTLDRDRPWIAPAGWYIIVDPTTNLMKFAVVSIKNGGRNPAIHVAYSIKLIVTSAPNPYYGDPKPLPRNADCDKPLASGHLTMLPGLPTELPIQALGRVEEQMADAYLNRKGLYIEGCLEYSQSGKERYRTEISEKFLHPATPRRPGDIGGFAFTSGGNDAY